MNKPNIIIIGGGIGGLSCATALAETQQFNIYLYESDILGGQASSKKSKLCNTEISWRVFGKYYTNLSSIINDIGSKELIYNLKYHDACINDNLVGPVHNPIYATLKNNNLNQINKILEVYLLSKERAINNYHNITANDFFKSNFMNLIIGPYFGLEPSEVTLSAYYKFFFSFNDKQNIYNIGGITKYPTNDSLFKPWKKYLQKKGVQIYENHALNNIITDDNGNIKKLIINDKIFTADEIVFALSLQPLVKIFKNNPQLYKKPIYQKFNSLQKGLQYYISVNFYWKKTIIKDRKCHIYTFIDGWMPIIVKRFINNNYIEKNCNPEIKEVWNIGVADYLIGNYIKKYTSQSSFEEIIYEIKMNLINSAHFKKYFDLSNNTWEDIFYGYEFDDRYYRKLPTTEKFSINKNIEHNLVNNKEPELGDNIYFSSYIVKNSVGGASMETSCEIGLETADIICQKYNIKNYRKPIYKNKSYINCITLPLVVIDNILYKMNLPPMTKYIKPFIILIIYFCILLLIIILLFRHKNILRNK